jgi:hypothetical protein
MSNYDLSRTLRVAYPAAVFLLVLATWNTAGLTAGPNLVPPGSGLRYPVVPTHLASSDALCAKDPRGGSEAIACEDSVRLSPFFTGPRESLSLKRP